MRVYHLTEWRELLVLTIYSMLALERDWHILVTSWMRHSMDLGRVDVIGVNGRLMFGMTSEPMAVAAG